MISDLGVLALEIGYVAAAAVIAQTARALVRAIDRRSTAAAIHRMAREVAGASDAPEPERACDYRTNARTSSVAEASRPSWLERHRSARAARYVRKLEARAAQNIAGAAEGATGGIGAIAFCESTPMSSRAPTIERS